MKKILYTIISYMADLWFPRRRPPELRQGATQKGYGRVNCWASGGKSTLRRDLIRCAIEGVTIYHVELMGWAEFSAYRIPGKLDATEKMYRWLVAQCRALGLWCFVSLTNDNAGSRKYGDTGRPLRDIRGDVSRMIGLVGAVGPDNVLVQPVGETQTDAGRQIEAEAAQKLHGFTLVNNLGSRPTSKPGWAAWNAYHPFKTSDAVPSNTICVSDTGTIIAQLHYGLDPTGKGKPDTIRAWARRLKQQGNPAVVLYAFKLKEYDSAAIKALGEA